MQSLFRLIAFGLLLTLVGCADGKTNSKPTQESPQPRLVASKLKVLVVDDPGISEGLQLLSGEWTERSGGELVIEQSTPTDFLATEELSADLIVYPSRYVGELVQRGWIRPVRKSVLESEEAAIKDLFPLVRDQTQKYGRTVYGLSLGEPPLMLRINGDPQESQSIRWKQIVSSESKVSYPLAVALLARGVFYSQGRSGTIDCFDPDSMQPQIDRPPFVRALQEMIDRDGSETQPDDNQLSWPTYRSDNAERLATLPIPEEVYHPLREAWVENDLDRPITVLGVAGRMVSVSKTTRNSSSAFKFMTWLISADTVRQVSPRSQATAWFRKSQARNVGRSSDLGSGGAQLAASVGELLSSPYYFVMPRIPGIDDYLESLDAAAGTAISERQDAKAVLAAVANRWESLTDQLGRDRQRTAYRQHLGLEDSEN